MDAYFAAWKTIRRYEVGTLLTIKDLCPRCRRKYAVDPKSFM